MIEKIKIFICYANEDKNQAERLFYDLKKLEVEPWFDKKSLLPGQRWHIAIERAIKDSRFVIVILSNNSMTKRGFIQKEIKIVLDSMDEFPDDLIYLIPVRIENCEIKHNILSNFHYVDMFPSWKNGIDQISRAIYSQIELVFERKLFSYKNSKGYMMIAH